MRHAILNGLRGERRGIAFSLKWEKPFQRGMYNVSVSAMQRVG